jgi:hypothetical protein
MPAKTPKNWKPFRLADGTTRLLPSWADKPLPFAFDATQALRRGMAVKPPKNWKKAIRAKRLARV